jgi:phage FluMu protein Com
MSDVSCWPRSPEPSQMARELLPIDCRCACGSLMAKITPQGIEIKCRRCKRVQVISNRQTTRHGRAASTPYSR